MTDVGAGSYTAPMSRLQLVDCPGCACLIDLDDKKCPFCGHAQRRIAGASVLSLGFMMGLATASCGEKDGGTDPTTTTQTSNTGTDSDAGDTFQGTAAYAGPGPTTSETTDSSSSTPDPSAAEGSVAYAGPPETDTGDSASDTGTTDVGGGTAYAGPAESTSTSDDTDSGSDSGSDTGTGTGTGTGTTSPVFPGGGR